MSDSSGPSFSEDGATFIPFLGADAAQNYPLRLEPECVRRGETPLELRAALPRRTEQKVRFDRGSLTEVYEATSEHLEQMFL